MRIRTIKPEFWSHPITGRLDGETQAFLIGLLNYADDEGYFYADPAAVRSAIRPFDDTTAAVRRLLAKAVDIGWLQLADHPTHGAIGFMPTFASHQRIDRGADSKIKEYWEVSARRTLDDASTNARRTLDEQSLLERKGTGNREQGKEQGSEGGSISELQSAWNEKTTPPIPRWEETSKHRRKAAQAALKRRPLSQWCTIFELVEASAFCRGENDRGWRADVDWAIRPEGNKPEPAQRLLEGAFATGPPPQRPKSLAPARAEDSREAFEALAGMTPDQREQAAMEAFAL